MTNPRDPNRTNPTNPTGEHFHAPHEPRKPHSVNDPLQTITPNPPGSEGLLNQDPKFGNLAPDGVHTTDGKTVANPDRNVNPDGSYYTADGGLRNADGTDVTRNADGSYTAADGTLRNADGTSRG